MNLVGELVHRTRQLSHGRVTARACEEREVNIRANKGLWAQYEM